MRIDHLKEMLSRHRSDRGRQMLMAAVLALLALGFTVDHFVACAR